MTDAMVERVKAALGDVMLPVLTGAKSIADDCGLTDEELGAPASP